MNTSQKPSRATASTHVFYIEAMLRMVLRELRTMGVKGVMAHSENAAG